MKDTEMPEPTTEIWANIANEFFRKTNFPNCIGAIDGKHIRCMKPIGSGSNFYNYKKYFSVVLMALADANLKFIAIGKGAYGKEEDSTVFQNSALGQKLYSGTLNLPQPKCLPNSSDNMPQPFVVVADEAFKLSTNLLKPYPSRQLTARKRVFNYRLSRCRRSVECAFGVLANKWRVFHTPIMVKPDTVDSIVKACCILHNFVRQRDGINFEDAETHPFSDFRNVERNHEIRGTSIRDSFADYFMDAGAVPFQRNYMF